jgi:hypothetical protein
LLEGLDSLQDLLLLPHLALGLYGTQVDAKDARSHRGGVLLDLAG